MCISGFVVDGSVGAVTRNVQIDIQDRLFSFRDCMCEVQSRMKIGDKSNLLFKFNAATTCNAYCIVDVSLV